MIRRRCSLAVFTAILLGSASIARAGEEILPDRPLPQGVTPLTREHLVHAVPNVFHFDYDFEPLRGKRLYLRVDEGHWVERYPDGSESRFEVLGRTRALGMSGIVIAKVSGDRQKTGSSNDGGFLVFIPDKGSPRMHSLYRHGRRGEPLDSEGSWSWDRGYDLEGVE